MKLKLAVNGTLVSLVTERGETIENVVSIHWQKDVEDVVRITVEFIGIGCEAERAACNLSKMIDKVLEGGIQLV